ncbi:hypothetical protein ACTI_39970 [Actinoplanes sp. OR16]|uniref:hypothetical protein n=1 Tax=Actinoplanes sp. OR16 TaxID=946334 RepID=UPI000F6CB357|nr:hypothetical protein [Actinoplanes sp. OR16]BBH67312.1 hypothetical protein ACTI_39970 [Actinoplanes sp. OR16]
MLFALIFLILILLAAALGRERRARLNFIDGTFAFACRVRACGPPPTGWRWLRRNWSRRMWARWTGDVLMIRRGPVFDRTRRLAAEVTATGVYVVPRAEARRCGTQAIAVRLRLPDGALIEVTADRSARAELVGPFLAAAISDLPRAPVPRRDV